MEFRIEGTISVERVEGKFASGEDIAERIQEHLDSELGSIDLTGLGAEGNSSYEVNDVSVVVEHLKAGKAKKKP